MRRVGSDADPTRIGIGAMRLGEPRRHADFAIRPSRADPVARSIERGEHALGGAGGFLQHGGGIGFVHRVEAEDMVQQPRGFGGRGGDGHRCWFLG